MKEVKELHEIKEKRQEYLESHKAIYWTISIVKLAVFLLIIVGIPLYVWYFHGDALVKAKSLKTVMEMLQQYKGKSVFIYIGLQVAQIVISVIPGQAFQFAAGWLYGFFLGLFYSIIGASIGTTLAFFIAKLLGQDALHLFFSKEKIDYFVTHLNSKKAYMAVFLIYLIPGFPKDLVAYAAGVSEMNFKAFLILSLIGRTPGMAGSLLIGALYFKGHYISMGIIGALAVIAFFIGIWKRNAIKAWLDGFYVKISN